MLFLGKFGKENQNCLFKMKVGTFSNSNMQYEYSKVIFICSALDGKHFFWVQKIRAVFLRRVVIWINSNMLNSMIILICPAWTGSTLLGQIWSKKLKLFKVKVGS